MWLNALGALTAGGLVFAAVWLATRPMSTKTGDPDDRVVSQPGEHEPDLELIEPNEIEQRVLHRWT